jgi:chloramphenicol-sensitive protein RarD
LRFLRKPGAAKIISERKSGSDLREPLTPMTEPRTPVRTGGEPVDRTGMVCAVTAYGLWGLAPVYFKLLGFASTLEIVAHRVLWSVVVLTVLVALRRQFEALLALRWREVGWLALSGALISLNWGLYVWALHNERMIEASLGYFINPLVNVVLGALFFNEWFRPAQKIALGLAALGVLNEIVGVGVLPWLGLTLALSFGFYGLVRKRLRVDAALGLTVETLLMLPAALVYLAVMGLAASGTLAVGSPGELLLLSAAGLVTVVPLVSFAAAAGRLPLSTLGFFQYLAPSMTFLLAIFVYGEPFHTRQFLTFGCIWLALVIFSLEALLQQRRLSRQLGLENRP